MMSNQELVQSRPKRGFDGDMPEESVKLGAPKDFFVDRLVVNLSLKVRILRGEPLEGFADPCQDNFARGP